MLHSALKGEWLMQKFFKAFHVCLEWNPPRLSDRAQFESSMDAAAIVVIVMGLLSRLSLMEWFIVLILIGGMIALELVNAAIERVVDLDNDGMPSAG